VHGDDAPHMFGAATVPCLEEIFVHLARDGASTVSDFSRRVKDSKLSIDPR
jgi:hypothetical protein